MGVHSTMHTMYIPRKVSFKIDWNKMPNNWVEIAKLCSVIQGYLSINNFLTTPFLKNNWHDIPFDFDLFEYELILKIWLMKCEQPKKCSIVIMYLQGHLLINKLFFAGHTPINTGHSQKKWLKSCGGLFYDRGRP